MFKSVTVVSIDHVCDKEFGRERALHRFVDVTHELRDEFHRIKNGKYRELYYKLDRDSVNEYWAGMNEFIRTKKLRVIGEQAEVIDQKTCYNVHVRYRIEWEH